MTSDMTEELKNKLTERFEVISGDFPNDEFRQALLKCYLAGGEYGYELGIEKLEAIKDFVKNQKQMPPEFAKLVQDNFWSLVDNPEQNIPISDKQDRESKKW